MYTLEKELRRGGGHITTSNRHTCDARGEGGFRWTYHDRSTSHVIVGVGEGETEGISRHRIDIHVIHGGKEGFGGHITTGVRHM